MRKLFTLLTLYACIGCQQPVDSQNGRTGEKAEESASSSSWGDAISNATMELDNRRREVQDAAAGELDKLVTFEYHVVDINRESSSADLEARLGELGKERWDCFHIENGEKNLRVFCKRAPKTVLKFIPRVF